MAGWPRPRYRVWLAGHARVIVYGWLATPVLSCMAGHARVIVYGWPKRERWYRVDWPKGERGAVL